MSRVSATLVIALGRFGGEAASRLRRRVRTRREGRPADLALVEVPLDEERGDDDPMGLAGAGERVVEQVRTQLALSALVKRSAGESDRPWLDVLILGDLSEPAVRRALIPLVELIGRVTAARFANLLGRRDRRVVVIPLLALPETGVPDPEVAGAPSTEQVVRGLGERVEPKTRSFLLESQTSHYLLSRDQLVSSAVAMIELLVLAGLRDHPNLARFLQTGEGSRPDDGGGPYATFGVASVRVEGDLVRTYCRNRAALAIVKRLREGPEVGDDERGAIERDIRPDWTELRKEVGLAARSDVAFDQVEALLIEQIPRWECPELDPGDTPEEVRERKFGDDWYRRVGGAIDGLIANFEAKQMHQLAKRVDIGGLKVARGRRDIVRREVDRLVWEEPRGWAAARAAISSLLGEMKAKEAEVEERIGATTLPERPTPERLQKPVITLRQETERRPRPYRMVLLGFLLGLPAVLFGAQILNVLGPLMILLGAPWPLALLFRPPLTYVLALAIAAPTLFFVLRGIARDRHRELEEVRDDLKRAIEHLMTGREGSVLAYYLARLELAKDLWELRIARAERRLMQEELRRLDQIPRALDTLRDQLRASQRALGVRYLDDGEREDLSSVAPGGDLILRDAASGDLLRAVYDTVAVDEDHLAEAFFASLQRERPPWRGELPLADRDRIDALLDEQLDLPDAAELLARGARDEDRAGGAARQGVERVLIELSTRLAPALGLTAAGEARSTTKHVFAPAAAHELVERAREEVKEAQGEGLGSDWELLDSPRDDGRVYLVVMVTHLSLEGIGAFAP